MNREIKFRSWDKILKIMSYNPVNAINFNGQFLLNDGKFHDINKTDYILMQYTGLVDKNGKEIYEGDVVYICGLGNYLVRDIRADYDTLLNAGIENDLGEIIGNIYRNPELLNKEEND